MSELSLVFINFYFWVGFLVATMWPMARSGFDDEWYNYIRKPGETGLEFLGKTILVFIFWPAPVGAIGYYWLTEYVIPWLTQPKT